MSSNRMRVSPRRACSITLAAALGGCHLSSAPENSDEQPPPVVLSNGQTDAGSLLLDLFTDGGVNSFGNGELPLFPPSVTPARLALLPTPSKVPPAISGGTLAVTPDGVFAVAADPDRDAIYVRNSTGKLATITLPAGSEPQRIAFDHNLRAHVVLRGAGALARIDLTSATLLASTPVCSEPRGVAYDASRDQVSVVCASGRLITLAAADHAANAEITIDADSRDVVSDGMGGFKVSRFRSAELVSIAANGRITQRSAGKPSGRTAVQQALPSFPSSDSSEDVLSQQTLVPTVAWRVRPGPNGTTWMLHQQSQRDPVAEAVGGYGGNCQAVTVGAATEFDASGVATRVVPLALSGLSVDAAVSASGKWLAVASPGAYLMGSSTLQLYSTDRGSTDLPSLGCVGPELLEGSDVQITAVDFDAHGVLYAFSREPAAIASYIISEDTLTSVTSLKLYTRASASDVSVRDTGHDLFHADVGTGLACASCHGEATDDGHVWTFEQAGARRTQNLRGGILDGAPYHWAGDLANIQQLLDEVMTRRMGGFTVDPAFSAELGRWLDAQPQQHAAAVAGTADAVARGKTLFHDPTIACASCHSAPSFTNHQSADVGTGGSFQVPSLRGVAFRPPYMHDGCAATLGRRFDPDCGGGDRHGMTSQLNAQQRADLIAYLTTL